MKGNCGECYRRWYCEINPDDCDEWPDPVPMTNADRIRSMSDEELAKILGNKCIYPPTSECVNCFDCWLEWLQQPAESRKRCNYDQRRSNYIRGTKEGQDTRETMPR